MMERAATLYMEDDQGVTDDCFTSSKVIQLSIRVRNMGTDTR